MSKFLPYPRVRSSKYYSFERKEVSWSCSTPRSITELGSIKFYENLNEMVVILSLTEAEDMESAVHTVVEAAFWMDWWTLAARSISFPSSSDSSKIKQLFVGGARCQLLVAKAASTVLTNVT